MLRIADRSTLPRSFSRSRLPSLSATSTCPRSHSWQPRHSNRAPRATRTCSRSITACASSRRCSQLSVPSELAKPGSFGSMLLTKLDACPASPSISTSRPGSSRTSAAGWPRRILRRANGSTERSPRIRCVTAWSAITNGELTLQWTVRAGGDCHAFLVDCRPDRFLQGPCRFHHQPQMAERVRECQVPDRLVSSEPTFSRTIGRALTYRSLRCLPFADYRKVDRAIRSPARSHVHRRDVPAQT